jgi:digeranylgeranylglycerophospholipid reductase
MDTVSDVIVVGGGPCGSFSALNLAKLGVNVTVFEEHGEIGVPSHCPGHMSIKGLNRLGLFPLPAGIVENFFYGAVFHSSLDKEIRVRFPSPVTCVVNRILFDKHIARQAEKAGAHFFLGSRVVSLNVENSFVKGVTVKRKDEVRKFTAKIVVDAEGVSSRLLRQTGLSALNRSKLVSGVEAEVENVKDMELGMVEVFLGNDYAPKFYAWLIPLGDGKAKIGLGANKGNPKELLQLFMHKHPAASRKLQDAKILQIAFHPITLGGQILKTCSNGFLAVGDVASQVKPTTGGGVILGLTCAQLAAETVNEALRRDDFSSHFLSKYQKQYTKTLGFNVNVMLMMRKLLDNLSDKQVDDVLGFCSKFKLHRILQSVNDIYFQGRSILHTLQSPRMLTALLYFGYLYLSANP